MKKILFLGVLLFGFATASAQAPLEEGRMQVNAGLGFSDRAVPVYVGIDYGVHPDITVGGELSYRSRSESFYDVTVRSSAIGIMGNANYHFNRVLEIPSEFDVYGGVSLGYYIWSNNYSGDRDFSASNTSGLGFYGQVGGRYFFSDNLGVNLEFGGGSTSGGKVGITYKF